MISFVYNTLWHCVLPFLTKNKRLSIGIEERYGNILPPHCDIWIHGASAGEISLITECLRRLSYTRALSILITTWTKEGKQIAQRYKEWATVHTPLVSISIYYFPFDTKEAITRFLDAVQPSLVLIAETELWYMLFMQCTIRKIPFCIINARLSHKTYRYAYVIRKLFARCNPNQVIAISNEDKTRFISLFPQSTVTTMHNIKFESLTIEQVANPIIEPHIVFASIRNKEYLLIAKTIALLQKDIFSSQKIDTLVERDTPTAIRYYIIPRHLHHINELQEALQKEELAYTVCTSLEEAKHATTQVILINIFGVSKEIYSTASIVFIGGSLLAHYGGHNFLEPLTYGIVPIVGPYRATFQWAEEGLHERNLIYSLQEGTPHALASSIQHQWYHREQNQQIQKRFSQWLQDKKGGSQTIGRLLQEYHLI